MRMHYFQLVCELYTNSQFAINCVYFWLTVYISVECSGCWEWCWWWLCPGIASAPLTAIMALWWVGPVTLNPSVPYCPWSPPWSPSWSQPPGSRFEWTCSFRVTVILTGVTTVVFFGSNQSDNTYLGSHASGATRCRNSGSSNAGKCVRMKCLNVDKTVSTQYQPISWFILLVGH